MQGKTSQDQDQPAETPHYHGHRERLRERFTRRAGRGQRIRIAGTRAVPGHPPARHQAAGQGADREIRLVRRGRSCAGARLREIDGLGDARSTSQVIAAAASRLARGEVKRSIALSSWSAVIDYCRTSMAFADKEQFRMLFLDKRNQMIADEVQQTGTVDHTPVYPREVVKRALELARPRSSWCTTIPPAIRRRRRPISR